MRRSRGPDHINETDDRIQRGIDADAHVGAENIVVNGAGQTDHGQAQAMQRSCALERAVAPDDDETVDAVVGQNVEGATLARLMDEIGATAGLEKGSRVADAPRNDDIVEIHELVVEKSLVAIADADDLQTLVEPGAGDGADGRIHAGGIST